MASRPPNTKLFHLPPKYRSYYEAKKRELKVGSLNTAVKILAYGADKSLVAYMWLSWLPTRHRAITFFEAGQVYEFTTVNPWLNLWEEKDVLPSVTGTSLVRYWQIENLFPKKRLPTGSVFLVLNVDRREPDLVILKVLCEDTTGYVVLSANHALKPWTGFNKLTTTPSLSLPTNSDNQHHEDKDKDDKEEDPYRDEGGY